MRDHAFRNEAINQQGEHMSKRSAGGCAVAVVASTAMAATAAMAAQSSGNTELAEVVVTATRQETNLQETPLAITAVAGEVLAERSIETLSDLGSIVPNTDLRQSHPAFGKGVTAFIRGVGQGDTNLNAEPGVAYYIDDVYYPLLFGSNFDLLDLERVEVLRGPQGTLFGRNALAGAISLVSKAPDPAQLSAYAELTTGAYQRLDLRGGINLPLGDRTALRVSAVSKKREGYVERLDFRCEMERRGTPELAGNFPYAESLLIDTANFTPESCGIGTLGGEDVHAARAQLLWNATDKLALTLTGDWLQDNSENAADELLSVNAVAAANAQNVSRAAATFTAPGGALFAYDSRFLIPENHNQIYSTWGDPIPAGAVIPVTAGLQYYNGTVVRGGFRYRPVSPLTNWGLSGRGVYRFTDDIALTAVVGYRSVDTVFSNDTDGSPLALETTRNNSGEQYWSGEVRLAGHTGQFDWVGGLFLFEGDGYVRTRLAAPMSGQLRYQTHTYEPSSRAFFANLVWHPLDKLGVTAGARYSDDKNDVHYSNLQDQVPTGDIVFDVTPQDERWDWKFGLDYQFTDEFMAYASASTGFRLPTFNARPFQPSQVTQISGEDVIAYELGLKTDWFDNRLRVNLAGFYTDYKTRPASLAGQEYQLGPNGQPLSGNSVTIPLPGGPDGSTTCRVRTAQEISSGVAGFTCIARTYYYNNPARVRGVEAEFEARPMNRLSLTGTVGYTTFDSKDINAPTRVNKRVTGIPEWNASAGAQYEFDAPALGGTIVPRLDWYYTGSIAFSASRTDYNEPAYSVFNARIAYRNTDHDLELALGATNLFDKFYYRNMFTLRDFGLPMDLGQPGPPREWFLSVRKNF